MLTKASVPLSAWRPIATDRFLFGAAYYPEHVDRSYWERDAARMAECGCNVARMGEFAWHIFEPREDVYDFGLFDGAIEVLAQHGIQTIMCTPTAAPPRWLTVRYPEVLRLDRNGRPMSHGSRQHADTTSAVFRQHSRRITAAMATHYAGNANVIGWQTDNELNTSISESFSPTALAAFQEYLRDRYRTIDALNKAWGGDFWATGYDGFEDVVLPHDFAPAPLSPGHVQDYHRFLAAATAAFQHDQVEILRRANRGWFVFHNVGHHRDIDFRGPFSTDLDFLGFDFYPMLHDEMQRIGGHDFYQALQLDIARGYTGNFIVPEQQSGFGSQPGFVTAVPEPGEMRRMAMTAVARGADGLLFFRWRPAHFGAEIYWMGIVDHDDVPRRRFAEAKRFGADVRRLERDLLGTSVHIDVGIAGSDFDNQEAHKTYSLNLPDPREDAIVLHRHCWQRGIACGFVHPEDDLSRLKVFYVPHWVMWNPAWTPRLEQFARRGGTVIIGALTGTRDADNHVIRETAPGASLAALAGVTVEEFGRLPALGAIGLFDSVERATGPVTPPARPAESSRRPMRLTLGNREYPAAHLYELLKPMDGTDVVGRWSSRFASGQAAVTTRRVGKGRVVYFGSYLTEDLVEGLASEFFSQAGVEPLLADPPEGVEVSLREARGRGLLFIINTRSESVAIAAPPVGTELLSGSKVGDGPLHLDGYGCAVIRLAN